MKTGEGGWATLHILRVIAPWAFVGFYTGFDVSWILVRCHDCHAVVKALNCRCVV